MAMLGTGGRQRICSRFWRKEEFLQIGSRHLLQSPPLFDWDEHRRFYSPLGHDLWSLGEARL